MRLRFQYRRYRLPLRVAVRTAHGVMTEREGVLVRLEAVDSAGARRDGVAGLGEAAPVPGFGRETVDEIEAACRGIGEWVESETLLAKAGPSACLGGAMRAALAGVRVEGNESEGGKGDKEL